jgi:hypothetical protein
VNRHRIRSLEQRFKAGGAEVFIVGEGLADAEAAHHDK